MKKDRDPGWITIVSGLPRSGTSLMMQMLAAGGMPLLTDQVRAADEDNPRGYYEFEPVKRTRQDPSWLESAMGKAVKMVHVLLYDLPSTYRYRVLFMRRKLDEVLASQRIMLIRQGKNGAALPDAQLAHIFESQLNVLTTWLGQQHNFATLPVCYNQLIADPTNSVSQVNRFLGGALHAADMVQVVDPTLYRQRR